MDRPHITSRKPAVPEEVQAAWQLILDLLAKIADVPAALIRKLDAPQIQVFASSQTEGNPFLKGDVMDIAAAHFCAAVISRGAPLIVRDTRLDPEWQHHNPALSLGMTYYLGYPLRWPDGEIFGTICVFDREDNPRATALADLIVRFQQMIERDLRLIVQAREREERMEELQRDRDFFKSIAGREISELLGEYRDALEDRFHFEGLVADLSSRFINIRPDELDREIAGSLAWSSVFLRPNIVVSWKYRPNHGSFVSSGRPAHQRRIREALPWNLSHPPPRSIIVSWTRARLLVSHGTGR